MTPIYIIFISIAGLVGLCVWLLVKYVRLHLATKRREILEDLGFIKDGLADIVEKGKEVEDLCERLKRHENTVQPIDINDVEFVPDIAPSTDPVISPDINEVFAEKLPRTSLSIAEIEGAFEMNKFADSYKEDYLHQPDKKFKASSGKCVLIRPAYHRKIQDILYAANAECSTISGFIDNILYEHFTNNAINVEEILNPSNKRI